MRDLSMRTTTARALAALALAFPAPATGQSDAPIQVEGFESAFSTEGVDRLSAAIDGDDFRGAIDRGDLDGFCSSFGEMMDAVYHEPWVLAEVSPEEPFRGCAMIARAPDVSFMCCPCKYPGGEVHEACE